MYSEQIKLIYKKFDKKNILVMFYEDLIFDERLFFNRIFNFLKINTIELPAQTKFADSLYSKNKFLHNIFNISLKFGLPNNYLTRLAKKIFKKMRGKFLIKYPKIGVKEKEELLKFYKDDISKLELILNKNLDSWKNIAK